MLYEGWNFIHWTKSIRVVCFLFLLQIFFCRNWTPIILTHSKKYFGVLPRIGCRKLKSLWGMFCQGDTCIRSDQWCHLLSAGHTRAHTHAHTVEAARSRWSPCGGSRWSSDSLRLRSSSAARTPGYISPPARLHLRRSLLEISRWRRSLVGTSFSPGQHALLLDKRRVDPRRRTPLWISRQGTVSFFNVMCWR